MPNPIKSIKKNPELYQALLAEHGVTKSFLGLRSERVLPASQLENITRLNLKNVSSLDGIEHLPNLSELTCQIDRKIDFDSYCRGFAHPSLETANLYISTPRALQGEDMSLLPATVAIRDSQDILNPPLKPSEIKLMNDALDEIKASVTPDGCEHTRVQQIYQALGNMLEYDDDAVGSFGGRSRSLQAALVDRKAMCTAYSRAFEIACGDNGIEAVSKGGHAYGPSEIAQNGGVKPEPKNEIGDHQWSQVKVNGEWYNCDLTFDSASDKEAFRNGKMEYFLCSDEKLQRTHTPLADDKHHPCTSTKYDSPKQPMSQQMQQAHDAAPAITPQTPQLGQNMATPTVAPPVAPPAGSGTCL